MKVTAMVLNIMLLIAVGFLIADEGMPSDGYIFLFLLMLGTPVASIIAIHFTNSDSWLTLYFRRKAAEERKRLSEIES